MVRDVENNVSILTNNSLNNALNWDYIFPIAGLISVLKLIIQNY